MCVYICVCVKQAAFDSSESVQEIRKLGLVDSVPNVRVKIVKKRKIWLVPSCY